MKYFFLIVYAIFLGVSVFLLPGCAKVQTCTLTTYNPRDSYTGSCDSGVIGESGEIAIGFDAGQGIVKCAHVTVQCPIPPQ